MMEPFHPALGLTAQRPLVFTAFSAECSYLKERISAFVLKSSHVPLNPFLSFGYFLYGLVEPNIVRQANNNLLMRADELWVFLLAPVMEVADGVRAEIALAIDWNIVVRYFSADHHGDWINEIPPRHHPKVL